MCNTLNPDWKISDTAGVTINYKLMLRWKRRVSLDIGDHQQNAQLARIWPSRQLHSLLLLLLLDWGAHRVCIRITLNPLHGDLGPTSYLNMLRAS